MASRSSLVVLRRAPFPGKPAATTYLLLRGDTITHATRRRVRPSSRLAVQPRQQLWAQRHWDDVRTAPVMRARTKCDRSRRALRTQEYRFARRCHNHRLTADRNLSAMLLEARQACDGATARNGTTAGRIATAVKFGQEQAFKIVQNAMDALNLTEEIIAKEGIDCDFWRGLASGTSLPTSSASYP
ncbi:Fad dependent oxidoreductase [Mycena sanguinolenta]|uniref:Fad dependent oxidoreductase n=1 Tax=Mycena sanguinolenta TaxID=230812 RepID=A0A8H7CFT9_9AGAR|nr:Fad dependent oxidoreductase [Mycena sanguinolenta]